MCETKPHLSHRVRHLIHWFASPAQATLLHLNIYLITPKTAAYTHTTITR